MHAVIHCVISPTDALETTMESLLDIYYTLLENVKYYFNDNTMGIVQLLQEDVLTIRPMASATVDIRERSLSDNMAFLVNLAFYFGERCLFFNVHYRILLEIAKSIV